MQTQVWSDIEADVCRRLRPGSDLVQTDLDLVQTDRKSVFLLNQQRSQIYSAMLIRAEEENLPV